MINLKKKNNRTGQSGKGQTRKKQPSRDDRLRAIKLRKIALFVFLTCALFSASFFVYYTDMLPRFKVYADAEILRISSEAGFRVKEIMVTGRAEISVDELLAKIKVKRDMPMFRMDIEGAQKSIAEIPWVKEVVVSRRLPDVVFVDIKERVPAALWQEEGKIRLIDKEGVILTETGLEKWKDLPLVAGKSARENIADLMFLLNAEPEIAKEVASATRVGERRWDLHLSRGITIKLPEKDQEFAIRRLAKLQEEKDILGKNIKVIDLREPEKLVVKLNVPDDTEDAASTTDTVVKDGV